MKRRSAQKKSAVMMAKDGKRVMHAELELNGGAFKLSDSFPEMRGGLSAPGTAGGTSVSMHLDFKKPKQVDEAIERAVNAGATVTMPAQDTFWGARYGRVRDPSVNCGRFTHCTRRKIRKNMRMTSRRHRRRGAARASRYIDAKRDADSAMNGDVAHG